MIRHQIVMEAQVRIVSSRWWSFITMLFPVPRFHKKHHAQFPRHICPAAQRYEPEKTAAGCDIHRFSFHEFIDEVFVVYVRLKSALVYYRVRQCNQWCHAICINQLARGKNKSSRALTAVSTTRWHSYAWLSSTPCDSQLLHAQVKSKSSEVISCYELLRLQRKLGSKARVISRNPVKR